MSNINMFDVQGLFDRAMQMVNDHNPPAATPVPDRGDSLLPAPKNADGVAGDPIDELAMLLVQSDAADRKSSRQTQRTEEAIQAREDDAQVQSMHNEADHIRSEGWAEGLTAIAGAGLSVVAGCTVPNA